MKPIRFPAAVLAVLMLPQLCAAVTSVSPDLSLQASDPCRSEVSRFEQAIGFIRQNQGNQAAMDLKERLLPAKLENDILFKDGYCGLARYIKEKKLNR